VKHHQYAEATSLSRRLKLNSIFTIIVIGAISVGSMALPLHAGQTVLSRLAVALTAAFAVSAR